MMRLFLIRHGQSETNVRWDNIVRSRQMNSHLTAEGQEQARRLADWLHARVPRVDAIYSSSLHRAWETAIPLGEIYRQTVLADHRIREGGYNYTNGEPIEDLTDEEIYKTHAAGFIGLQVHGIGKGAGPYEVSWRNLRIKEK